MATTRGESDRLLAGVASRLGAEGWPLAGAVQVNREVAAGRPCVMDLHVLDGLAVVRISQDLGALSKGCRLDPQGLEQAVALVERALDRQGDDRPRLLIVNKFGKQEAEGRGFRPLIGRALADGIPVLTAVNDHCRAGFLAFAGGIGTGLPAEEDQVLDWCRAGPGSAR